AERSTVPIMAASWPGRLRVTVVPSLFGWARLLRRSWERHGPMALTQHITMTGRKTSTSRTCAKPARSRRIGARKDFRGAWTTCKQNVSSWHGKSRAMSFGPVRAQSSPNLRKKNVENYYHFDGHAWPPRPRFHA